MIGNIHISSTIFFSFYVIFFLYNLLNKEVQFSILFKCLIHKKCIFIFILQLIENILEALSSIVMLMSTETLNRDCIVILTNILSLYKKCLSIGMSRYWVSQYLASFLSVVSEIMLEPVIDNLFSILHEMVNIAILKVYLINLN